MGSPYTYSSNRHRRTTEQTEQLAPRRDMAGRARLPIGTTSQAQRPGPRRDLAEDPRFVDLFARVANAAALVAILDEAFVRRTAPSGPRCSTGKACGPVQSVDELIATRRRPPPAASSATVRLTVAPWWRHPSTSDTRQRAPRQRRGVSCPVVGAQSSDAVRGGSPAQRRASRVDLDKSEEEAIRSPTSTSTSITVSHGSTRPGAARRCGRRAGPVSVAPCQRLRRRATRQREHRDQAQLAHAAPLMFPAP
jgi:hypothetical protein